MVVYDRVGKAFYRSGATWAAALDISKAFDRLLHPSLLHKLKSCGILGQVLALFCLLSVIDSFEGLWMESLQECLVKAKKFVFGVGKKNLHSGGCNFFWSI